MPCGAAFPTTRSLGDKTSGIYADPTKIEKIDFDGEYLKCHATPSVLPSAQLRPVLFQAGSSGRGRRFAVDHADVIFAIQPYLPRMGTFMTQIRDAAATAGRVEDTRVTFAVQPFIGDSLAAAEAKRDAMVAAFPWQPP